MRRRRNYPAPGLCVFCRARQGTTDEHIIPRAIGGSLVIRKGTCDVCREAIAPFEAKLMNTKFEVARVFLKIPSLTNKTRTKLNGFFSVGNDISTMKKTYVSSDVHPAAIIFLMYDAPGVEEGRPMGARFPGEELSIIIKGFSKDARNGNILMHAPPEDLAFPRLLAKIAHCYWAAECGLETISCPLPKFIISNPTEEIGFFVGGIDDINVPSDDLHFINYGVRVISGLRWGYVDIGLFATHAPQTNYRVYVGLLLK